jgi:hypothetical protein
MLRALCLAMTLIVLPLGSASADAPPDLGANAALKYWQAFAQLPKLTDAEQSKLNAEILTMPLDAHARELVSRADYALRMLYQGAAQPRCDWAIGWKEEGVDTLLPQMGASRVLSSLACLRARLRFEEGHKAEAIQDMLAALTLGRHASLDGSLIGILVGYSIEARLSEALALFVPGLDAETIKDLKKRLATLPAGGHPARALRECEEYTLDWAIRKVKTAKDQDSILVFLDPLFVEEKEPEEKRRAKALAFLKECGGTADGMIKTFEETRASYELMAKKLELSPDQFEKQFEQEEKRQAGNPAFKLLFPALVKVRWAQARADVRRALLTAAFAVQLDGRDALKDHPDPVMGGSFEYFGFQGGFELRSKLKQSDDKPVALTVGRRGK